MSIEKRMIKTFKAFVEKVFLPVCHKNDAVMQEWNKFSSIVNVDNFNLNDLQTYVDSIPSFSQSLTTDRKQQTGLPPMAFSKKKQEPKTAENSSADSSFNPSKTFGGEKTKFPLYPLKHQFEENKKTYVPVIKEDGKYRSTANNYSSSSNDHAPFIMSSLERQYKSLLENQQKIQNLTQANSQNQMHY